MFGQSEALPEELDRAGLGLDELRSQALTYLSIALAGSAWALNLAMPALTGSADATRAFFLSSLWLMATAVAGWTAQCFGVKLARCVDATGHSFRDLLRRRWASRASFATMATTPIPSRRSTMRITAVETIPLDRYLFR